MTDIGIGVDTYEAATVLAGHGIRFGWHPTERMLNRFGGWITELSGLAESPSA